ncbi:unnamed protein product, partial [Cuscuta epithymum]
MTLTRAKMEGRMKEVERSQREMQARMEINLRKMQTNIATMVAIQASIADIQNRLQNRSKSRSHSSHRSHRNSHHQHTRHSEISERSEEHRLRRETGERSKNIRHLPLSDKLNPSPSLTSSQMESRTVSPSSQSRSVSSNFQSRKTSSPAICSCPRKTLLRRESSSSQIDSHFLPASSQVDYLSSQVTSSTRREEPLSQSKSKSPDSQQELVIQEQPSREDTHTYDNKELKEESSVKLETEAGAVAGFPIFSKYDLDQSDKFKLLQEKDRLYNGQIMFIHACSFGSRVLIAYEMGALKIKNISDDKAVLIKSQEPRHPRELFSENSYTGKRRYCPDSRGSRSQEDRVDYFLGAKRTGAITCFLTS